MGTTLTTLQTGQGMALQLVLCIEGYDYLITDGDTAAAVTAWSGSGWTQALGGLFVEGGFEQSLDPWKAFPENVGEMSFLVRDESGADTIGLAMFAGGAGIETTLTADIDADDTTATVAATAAGAGFPSSGDIYIGTERIAYSGKTATTFTGLTRGKFAPFKANTEVNQRFGRPHRAAIDPGGLAPDIHTKVTSAPRVWVGKWVGLWAHRRVGTTLDTYNGGAQLLWAGKVTAVRDTDTGDTRISCRHVLDVVSNTVLLREQWQAEVAEGVYVVPSPSGPSFQATDSIFTAGVISTKTADPMTIVTGASGSAYELGDQTSLPAGYQTVTTLMVAINNWLAAAVTDGDLYGRYTFTLQTTLDGVRVVLAYDLSGTDGALFELTMPKQVLAFLGFDIEPTGFAGASRLRSPNGKGGKGTVPAQRAPYRSLLDGHGYADGTGPEIRNAIGTFTDQSDTLPQPAQAHVNVAGTWGIVLCEGVVLLVRLQSATKIASMEAILELQYLGAGIADRTAMNEKLRGIGRQIGDGNEAPLVLTQLIMLSGPISTIIPQLFASTGANGYNHATYDTLGFAGAAVPWQLLGDTFVNSCQMVQDAEPAAPSLDITLEKSVTLGELLNVDLILRGCYLMWKNGGLRFVSWSTPSAARAVHSLTEDNKASPVGHQDFQRTPMDITDQWMRNVVKIDYNRSVHEDTYRDSITLEDLASIGDMGDQRPVTLKARNTYTEVASTGTSIQALASSFLGRMPHMSRPLKVLARTVDMSLFEDTTPGDVLIIADNFARDPATGRRGIANKPGIIMKHRWDPGGPDPANPKEPRPMLGEVQIAILDVDVVRPWSPACLIDHGANTGGFTAGYDSANFKVRCVANEYSDPADSVTDTSYFAANDTVTVVEIDPSNPASPQSWNVTITVVSGSDLTLSAALTGFSSSKYYRIVSRDYNNSTTIGSNQQGTKTYQADDADLRIQDNAVSPMVWGQDGANVSYPATALTELGERYAQLSYGDGKPLDVGYEHGLIRTAQQLIHYKTAPQCPWLPPFGSYIPGSFDNYYLWGVVPYYVQPAIYPAGKTRRLSVSVLVKNTAGSGSPTVRLTLSRFPPVSGTTAVDGRKDCTILGPLSQATLTINPGNTNLYIPTAAQLDVRPADADGECYLIIEVGSTIIDCRGLAECHLGPLEDA